MISASDVADTLRLLVPGFVALKVFYAVGPRSRHSDLEWTLWSLLVAAPIDLLVTGLAPGLNPTLQLLASLLVAVVGGILVGRVAVELVRRSSRARSEVSRTVWDELWGALQVDPRWVQVWTTDGKVISGRVLRVSDSVETDYLDLLLSDPAWVGNAGTVAMTGVDRFYVPASSIAFVQVMEPATTPA